MERPVFRRRKVVRFFGGIWIENASMSSDKQHVRNVVAVNLRFSM